MLNIPAPAKEDTFWIKRSKAGEKNERARRRLTVDHFFLALLLSVYPTQEFVEKNA